MSTHARVLFEALAGVYSAPGFDAVADVVFRYLVIARVVEPTKMGDPARVRSLDESKRNDEGTLVSRDVCCAAVTTTVV